MSHEIRRYHVAPGRLDDLRRRFSDVTVALFREHGIEVVGSWVKREAPEELIYVVEHTGDPVANWSSFRADPRWQRAKSESEAAGALTTSIDSQAVKEIDLGAPADGSR